MFNFSIDVWPTKEIYTSVLSIVVNQNNMKGAQIVWDSILAHGIEPDIHVCTTIGYLAASLGDLQELATIFKATQKYNIVPDEKFFRKLLEVTLENFGVDACFNLFNLMLQECGAQHENCYNALIDIGSHSGLVERVLDVAYNMECEEGLEISSKRMFKLIAGADSKREVEKLISVFLQLHNHGEIPPHGIELEQRVHPFNRQVFQKMIDLVIKKSRKDALTPLLDIAESLGYENLRVDPQLLNQQSPPIGKKRTAILQGSGCS